MVCEGLLGAGNESVNDQGRAASEASGALAPEAVWKCGGGGLWSAAEGRPRAPWSSGRDRREGWADGLCRLGRDGPKGVSAAQALMRVMTAPANRH